MKTFWLTFSIIEIGFAVYYLINGDLPAVRDFIILAFVVQILKNQAEDGE